MIPGNTPQEFFGAAAAAAAGGAEPGLSVRFNSADSAYLSRTPASAGNRKTWTWSGWVKRSKLAVSDFELFSADPDQIRFSDDNGGNSIRIITTGSSVVTSQLFRDASAWYHIVVAIDTTQATASNRIKLYVNGSQVTSFFSATYPAQNADTTINSAVAHNIGALNGSYGFFDGYLALVHFIDGQALTPSSFGETSATTGQWIAKTYAGTYSGNSFFLDFLDNSAATATTLGKDSSGLGNNWTPNNILASSTGYSVYFDGAGDRITASNAQLVLGSGNWTVECFFKADVGYNTQSTLIGFTSNNPFFEFDSNKLRWINTTYTPTLTASRWYHAAWSRSGSTVKIFLDGVEIGSATDSTNYSNSALAIGSRQDTSTEFKGWISNVRIVVGTALYTSNFTPSAPLSAVSGTKLLTCQSSTIVDNSGNNISLTTVGNTTVSTDFPSSFAAVGVDSLRDHPTSAGTSTGAGGEVSGNYATLNPLTLTGYAKTYANGNLEVTATSNNNIPSVVSTFGARSGKWYAEVVAGWSASGIGFINADSVKDSIESSYGLGTPVDGWARYETYIFNNGVLSSGLTSIATNDLLQLALDLDNGKAWFGINGTWENSGNPANGTNPSVTFTPGGKTFLIGSCFRRDGTAVTMVHNYGARAFAYTAPSGFSPLVDTLLPTPTIAKPNTVMDVALYTGNATARSITGLGFNPDVVWIKCRSAAQSHRIVDAVRGATYEIYPNLTNAEDVDSQGVTAFNSDGFSLGTSSTYNGSGNTYAAWTWDAGSSNATNTSGTITSTVRANISAGFSVVSYTGTGANATVGHGLGAAPSFTVVKNRDFTDVWLVYHSSLGATKYIILNRTDAAGTISTAWNNTAPTSSVFSIGSLDDVNRSSNKFIAYCWTPVAGYSAFGSYTGNGSSDGPFVYTGFRPRWVMVKCTTAATTQDWVIMDAARRTYNAIGPLLYPNASVAEDTADVIDFTSNGFKIRATFGNYNTNTNNYIYAAFAEAPFPYARAR